MLRVTASGARLKERLVVSQFEAADFEVVAQLAAN
jgi:hypothetical protein